MQRPSAHQGGIAKITLNTKVETHNLTYQQLKHLDTNLNSPLMVFHSATVIGAFVIIVEKSNNEGLLCCTLKEDKVDKLLLNEITSIHGRRLSQITKWIEEDYLIDCNLEKTKKVIRDSGFNCRQCNYLEGFARVTF